MSARNEQPSQGAAVRLRPSHSFNRTLFSLTVPAFTGRLTRTLGRTTGHPAVNANGEKPCVGSTSRNHTSIRHMKLYGYSEEGRSPEAIEPRPLAEVTLCATPEELRSMSKFLAACADEMVRMGATYDHVHLSDRRKEFRTSPHFVVAAAVQS